MSPEELQGLIAADVNLAVEFTPLLTDAFNRSGIVARTARGIDTIFWHQLRSGRPAPSSEMSNESGVVVQLPGGDANLDFVRLLVVQYVEKHGRITRKEAAELCKIGPQQATRLLNRLVKSQRLRRFGERKASWYERGTNL